MTTIDYELAKTEVPKQRRALTVLEKQVRAGDKTIDDVDEFLYDCIQTWNAIGAWPDLVPGQFASRRNALVSHWRDQRALDEIEGAVGERRAKREVAA